jgi:hypothetical protein
MKYPAPSFSASVAFCAVLLPAALFLSGCTCDKSGSIGENLNSKGSTPVPTSNPAREPRFPNEAAIFFVPQKSDEQRVCWYLRPKDGEKVLQLLTQKAFKIDEFRTAFQNKDWLKSQFPSLNESLIEASGRALLRPISSPERSIRMVDVGPAGFDWLIQGIGAVRGIEGAPECDAEP